MKFVHYFNCVCKRRDGRPMQLSAVTGGHVRCKCGTKWYVNNPDRICTGSPPTVALTVNSSGILESGHTANCACHTCAILAFLGSDKEAAT